MIKKVCLLSLLICLSFVLSTSTMGKAGVISDESDARLLGSIGGMTNTVAVSEDYLYLGKGTSIIILEKNNGNLG